MALHPTTRHWTTLLWMCMAQCLFLPTWLQAQGIATLTVDRNPVVVGQPFRITFEFKDARVDFNAPPAIDGIRLINGPSTSTSTQIVNGAMSSSRSYTYSAVAAQPGLIQIPALTFESSEGPLKTAAVTLRVAGAGAEPSRSLPPFSAVIEVDRKKVHLGEPIQVEYRIYNRLDGVNLQGYSFPELSGVWKETVEDEEPHWENTIVDGQRFQVATLKTDILYPTRTGELTLDGFDVEAMARLSLFNTRPLSVSAPAVRISVEPLPDAPLSPSLGTFSGLDMKWTAQEQNPRKSNEAINVTLEFSGRGNLSLLGAPEINWPPDLEVFDPEIQDRIRTTSDGQRGKRTFNYLVIPRAQGQFTLDLPSMSYFDYQLDRHVELTCPSIEIEVEGNAQEDSPAFGFNSKSDVTILTRDVRFIRTETELKPLTYRFFGGPFHLMLWGFPPAAFMGLILARMRRNRARRDPLQAQRKKARQGLKQAVKSAQKGEGNLDDLSPAVHAFLQAELNLPQSESTMETYADALFRTQSKSIAEAWLDILTVVDRGRFAPGAPAGHDIADRIERAAVGFDPKNSTDSGTHRAWSFMSLCMLPLAAVAAPDPSAALAKFQAGNVAYTQGDFDQAIASYEEVSKAWTSFELEYNLGGAHYKAGHIGPCVLHYERARQLRPNDDDLKANLLLVQSAVTDRIEALPDMGMSSIWRELISEERLPGWTCTSLALWLLGFALLSWRLLTPHIAQKRILGLIAPSALLLALVIGALSRETHQRIVAQDGAVIMVPRVEVKGAPSDDPETPSVFILHEGTVVEILIEQDGWTRVRLANGNTGWLDRAALEAI